MGVQFNGFGISRSVGLVEYLKWDSSDIKRRNKGEHFIDVQEITKSKHFLYFGSIIVMVVEL